MKDVSFNIGQTEIAAVEAIRKLGVVNAHLVQNRGMNVMSVDSVFHRLVAEFICGAVLGASFESASRKPGGKRIRVVVPAADIL